MYKSSKSIALIDNRHLKILAAKRKEMKDSIVFVCLDEEKYGTDKSILRRVVEHVEKIEPDGIYFPLTQRMHVEFYDISEFRNKDIVVIFQQDDNRVDKADIETEVLRAIPEAKSLRFIHRQISFRK